MSDESEEAGPQGPLLGSYANYFEVGHNACEVLLDFGQFYAENARARVHTRIIMNPSYAKALLRTLSESLLRYEQAFGPIDDPTGPTDS
jgi:hypothetical protein